MANWYQEHPVYTIVGHTIVVATATWLVSSFVIDENRVNLYRAKAENSEAQINNEKAIAEQYKAKISVLEYEVNKLQLENQKYLSWLNQDPRSVPALENKISALEKKIANIKTSSTSGSTGTDPATGAQKVPYEFKSPFIKGGSFVDPKTKATIGVSDISADYTATGILYLPGNESIELKRVKPGTTWEFEQGGSSYKVTLDGINWINNSLEASVVELDANKKPNKAPKPTQ